MTKEEADNGRDDMLIDTPLHEVFNANYLKTYYGKLFPLADIFKWLSYGNDGKHPDCDQSYPGRREYAFTLDGMERYQSFKSVQELGSSIKENCPFKIDIGPVYSVDPRKRHAYQNVFALVERELIFDIDISDYDDVRYCCSVADACLDCCPFMTVAIKVIDTALRDDFGFNHILWVYSGRQGVHCWVCDAKARREIRIVREKFLYLVKNFILSLREHTLKFIENILKRNCSSVSNCFRLRRALKRS